MSTFATFCPARLVGRKISNIDVDVTATIAISKFATRTKEMNIAFLGGPDKATTLINSIWPAHAYADGSTTNNRFSITVPDDYDSGTLTLNVAVISSGSSGNFRWELDTVYLFDNVALSNELVTVNVTQASATTVNHIAFASITAPSIIADTLMSFNLQRLGADGADTSTDVANVTHIWLSYTGRA